MAMPNKQAEITRLLSLGALDNEIMQTLNIKRAMYYRYKQRIFHQARTAFEKQTIQDMAFHKEILHNRLSRFLRHIETKLAERDNRTGNSLLNPREYAALALAGQNIAVNLFKLQYEGIRILERSRNVNDQLQQYEEEQNKRPYINNESEHDRYPPDVNSGSSSGGGVIRLLPYRERPDTSGTTRDRTETRFKDSSTNTETFHDESTIY